MLFIIFLIQVQIEPDGSWVVLALGRPVRNNPYLNILPQLLTAENVKALFDIIGVLTICEGNPEFPDLCRNRYPDSPAVFAGKKNMAREELTGNGGSTIRHVNCYLLTQQEKCNECKNYKLTLNSLHHKLKNKTEIPAATTRHDCMTKEQLSSKLKETKAENKNLKNELKRLNKQIARETNQRGITLDPEQNKQFGELLEEHDTEIRSSLDEDSPQLLLWKQHLENSKKKGKTGHRWHPLILKWCIGLHHKSAAAYEYIRTTGMMPLPGSSTLRRYFHFTDPTPGYNPKIIEQVI